jgi:pantoate--beta-alanine ligase
MQIFKFKQELSHSLDTIRKTGKRIGFVPTMGAIHRGHISLVQRSKSENEFTVTSIFVNPTQFNDKNDFQNYPHTMDTDSEMLEKMGCDFLFCPSVEEMYPEPDKRIFDFGHLDKIMEGKHRPGHFNGVAQIVTKLFEIIKPDNAYFGEKDFQQLVIIKNLVKNLQLLVNIVSCGIVREPNGLAMSSRNTLLNNDERKNAVLISQILFAAQKLKNEKNIHELKKWVVDQMNKNHYLKVEYFDIVDDTELKPINDWSDPKQKIGCVAVKVGKVRLIDNIRF